VYKCIILSYSRIFLCFYYIKKNILNKWSILMFEKTDNMTKFNQTTITTNRVIMWHSTYPLYMTRTCPKKWKPICPFQKKIRWKQRQQLETSIRICFYQKRNNKILCFKKKKTYVTDWDTCQINFSSISLSQSNTQLVAFLLLLSISHSNM